MQAGTGYDRQEKRCGDMRPEKGVNNVADVSCAAKLLGINVRYSNVIELECVSLDGESEISLCWMGNPG